MALQMTFGNCHLLFQKPRSSSATEDRVLGRWDGLNKKTETAAVWPASYCEEAETSLILLNCDSVQSEDSNTMQ